MNQPEKPIVKILQTTHNRGTIGRMYSRVDMYLNKTANELLTFREVVFRRHKMSIERPSQVGSGISLKVSKRGSCHLLLKDEDLVGEYELEVVNEDCLKLVKVCTTN